MKKRLFIVHGWGDSKEPLLAWLGEQGTKLGFETTVLDMPNPGVPTIGAWVSHLESVVQYPDESTYFVGHSMGFQAILRYLQSPENSKTGSVLGIAPWLTLTGLETAEDKDIARPWTDNPIDFRQLKNVINKMTLIFSDNDPLVALAENEELFKKYFDPTIIIENGKGHLAESDGVKELPSALDALTKMAQE